MTSHSIGFVGMTHLGLNSAVAAADIGFEIVCYDPDPILVQALKSGELPVTEPDLPELLQKNADRIKFTADDKKLITCDIVYVAPDVPTDEAGRSDLEQIDALIRKVDNVLGLETVMVILSQVPPGFTRAHKNSGRELYYQVETLIFGRAMERARFPERFIVGCADPSKPLPSVLAHFLGSFGCSILPMRYESAELAKISINMCLVASIGVANTMAEICEKSGAEWAEIVPALKLDRRIGPYSYLNPGLGISGGNLERDLATILALSKVHETDAGIVAALVANSSHRKEWAWSVLNELVLAHHHNAKIAILGLAYKEDTHSTKNSPSLTLLAHLGNHSVVVFDPVVSVARAGIAFKEATSALEAIQGADVICIMTPWAEFKKLTASEIVQRMRGRWLIDPYGVVEAKAAKAAGLRYATLGISTETV
jgi:UDPglucose 6-dehydrogenase